MNVPHLLERPKATSFYLDETPLSAVLDRWLKQSGMHPLGERVRRSLAEIKILRNHRDGVRRHQTDFDRVGGFLIHSRRMAGAAVAEGSRATGCGTSTWP